MTNDMFFDEEIDSGYECVSGHPLRLVAEGYAICRDETGLYWWAWRMTPPPLATCTEWWPYDTQRGGAPDGHRGCLPHVVRATRHSTTSGATSKRTATCHSMRTPSVQG